MNKKEAIETVIGSTNVFLMENSKNFEDVVMYYAEKDETLTIYSGEKALFEGSVDECAEKIDKLSELVKGSVKKPKNGAKNVKSGANGSAKSKKKGAKERMRSEIDFVTEKVARYIEDANHKLAKITSSGFPYSYDEVEISLEHDSLGMYVHSGSSCVSAVMRAGNPSSVANVLIDKIRDVVDSTRAAVERRASLRDEENALKSEDEKTKKAKQALQAAGMDASEILGKGIDAESRAAIRAAVKKAVQSANRPTFLDILQYKDWKLTVCEYSGGIVIRAGDKPVLVTRYPKVASPKVVEQMISWITNDIESLNASRIRYFERVRLEADREERLRSISRQLDSIDRIAATM